MHLDRLRSGEALAGFGAIALVVLLSFTWFQPEAGLVRPRGGFELPAGFDEQAAHNASAFIANLAQSGWSGLGWALVVVLMLAVVAALTLVVLTVTPNPVALPIAAGNITVALGGIATLVLAVRLGLAQPDLGFGFQDAQVDVRPVALLGLVACACIPAGAWRSLADERKDVPGSAPPEVTPRPIPPTA